MKILILTIFATLIATIYCDLTNPDSTTLPPKQQFVLKQVQDESSVPFEALFVQHPTNQLASNEEYNPEKKFVAVPVGTSGGPDVGKVNGIVANLVENEDDDLMTAEAIVFRPLFRYRQQQENRQRYYGGSNRRADNDDTRVYRNPSNSQYLRRYPAWYRNAEFPVLP